MRRPLIVAVALLLTVQAALAAVPSPTAASSYWVWSGIRYNRNANCGTLGRCDIRMDGYIPAHPVRGSVVILLHGGPAGLGARKGLASLAGALAARGILTYSADYRDLASQGAGYANTMADIACATAAVRRYAPNVGGNARKVIVVGHSLGGWIGAAATMLKTLPGPCGTYTGAHPDIFYGLSGSYDEWTPQRAFDMRLMYGSVARIDPRLDTIAMTKQAHRHASYHVIAERYDTCVNSAASVSFAYGLRAAGDQVRLTMFSGSGHSTPATPSTADGATVVRMIVASALDPAHG